MHIRIFMQYIRFLHAMRACYIPLFCQFSTFFTKMKVLKPRLAFLKFLGQIAQIVLVEKHTHARARFFAALH